MERTYTVVFDPDPEGGFVVTCPALPGLVSYGATLDKARAMALDAIEGYVATLIEDNEAVPASDPPELVPRYDRLAQSLRDSDGLPILEQLTTSLRTAA
jgi:predicted RNase H-like HicB family nuclease